MLAEDLILPSAIKEDEKVGTAVFGRFIAEPYQSGYGHTIGNSLRRILLSSLEGAAVTAVRIDGVSHEYSTLPGVKEDVINILLNLKKLRARIEGGGKEYVYLSAKKSGAVTAGQIQETDNVEIVNKDLVIANIEPGGKLDMEIEISWGRGYLSVEELGQVTRPAGFIPLDAVFSPVQKVHYAVEPARVGQKTDHDRLVLEVTTDGTISPKSAVTFAADILVKSVSMFTAGGAEKSKKEQEEGEAGVAVSPKISDLLKQPIDTIELSSRSANCLKAGKIATVKDLVSMTEEDIKEIKNFGAKSLTEIKERLAEMGLSLGMKG